MKKRKERLLDLYIDGNLDQQTYHTRQEDLQSQIDILETDLASEGQFIRQIQRDVEQFFERSKSYILSQKNTPDDLRSQFLKSVSSNPTASPESVDIPIDMPWLLFVNANNVPHCGERRDRLRTEELVGDNQQETMRKIIKSLINHFVEQKNPGSKSRYH